MYRWEKTIQIHENIKLRSWNRNRRTLKLHELVYSSFFILFRRGDRDTWVTERGRPKPQTETAVSGIVRAGIETVTLKTPKEERPTRPESTRSSVHNKTCVLYLSRAAPSHCFQNISGIICRTWFHWIHVAHNHGKQSVISARNKIRETRNYNTTLPRRDTRLDWRETFARGSSTRLFFVPCPHSINRHIPTTCSIIPTTGSWSNLVQRDPVDALLRCHDATAASFFLSFFSFLLLVLSLVRHGYITLQKR